MFQGQQVAVTRHAASFTAAVAFLVPLLLASPASAAEFHRIPDHVFRDKVEGFWLGQLVGNYLGLYHLCTHSSKYYILYLETSA